LTSALRQTKLRQVQDQAFRSSVVAERNGYALPLWDHHIV